MFMNLNIPDKKKKEIKGGKDKFSRFFFSFDEKSIHFTEKEYIGMTLLL